MTGGDRKNRGGLYLIDVQTGEVTPVVHSEDPGGFPRQAAWSRDGKSVFYMHVGRELLLREMDSGRERTISTEAADFSVSPDGESLAITFDDQATRSSVLKIIPVTGGPGRELLRAPGSGVFTLGMSWTTDGRHLLFTKLSGNFESRNLWWIPVAGGEPQKLELTIDGLSQIRTHPNGRRITFTAGKYSAEIWEMKNLLRGTNQP